ncbi:7509_t:CDS:2, partial [Cetraspora pellucida]
THAASEECLLNPNNIVHTRVGVLREFFIELRNEEIFSTFVLLDKDSGEIAAAQEAWSQAVIQLCLWHVEHAIECKLKEKKPRRSQYSAQKANEAHQQFAFINPLWFPDGQQNTLYPKDFVKELLNMDLFKHDWKNAMEKDVNTENRYYTNINIWVCSCPAFIYSPYLICKHLVNKYSTENPGFFSRFTAIIRCHDYSLIAFSEINHPRINPENNTWNISLQDNNVIAKKPELVPNSNISTLISDQYTIIESRKEKLRADMKIYKALIKIMNENINNDKLFETYKSLKQPLISETIICIEVVGYPPGSPIRVTRISSYGSPIQVTHIPPYGSPVSLYTVHPSM